MTTARTSSPTQSEEEYLESIYKLTRDGHPARTEQVANSVGVTAAAASGMVKRMAAQGLVVHTRYAGVELTPEGERQALHVVRRHRLVERLLTDVLKVPWDAVHEQACRLEHAVLPHVEAKIEEMLGDASTCPHGQPIPTADGRVVAAPDQPLTSLEPGGKARIVRIALEASDFLRYLATLGLLPNVEVTVETKAPFEGPLMVRVGDAHYALGREVAGAIMVSPV